MRDRKTKGKEEEGNKGERGGGEQRGKEGKRRERERQDTTGEGVGGTSDLLNSSDETTTRQEFVRR